LMMVDLHKPLRKLSTNTARATFPVRPQANRVCASTEQCLLMTEIFLRIF
jgi:hypothetical protein